MSIREGMTAKRHGRPGSARSTRPRRHVVARLRSRSSLVDEILRSRLARALIDNARRGPAVDDSLRFVCLELFGERGRLGIHKVRHSRVRVALRHRSRDVEIFHEIFVGRSAYEAPQQVSRVLDLICPLRVLDLGGNVGLFGAYVIARWPESVLTSLEPDPTNLPLLYKCVEANGAHARWIVVPRFAAPRVGIVAFAGGRFADSAMAIGNELVTHHVAAVDVFDLLADSDFVKIDIEGGEWEIIRDPRWAESGPRIVVMEWHKRGCPSPDPYRFALAALHDAGYETESVDNGYPHGMIWAWRPGLGGQWPVAE
jgi:FkbM family methyltransferase